MPACSAEIFVIDEVLIPASLMPRHTLLHPAAGSAAAAGTQQQGSPTGSVPSYVPAQCQTVTGANMNPECTRYSSDLAFQSAFQPTS